MNISSISKPILAPSKSFQKKKSCVGGTTTMVTAQHSDRHAISVARRTTGLSCAEWGEAPHLATHPPHTSTETKTSIWQQAQQARHGRKERQWWQRLQERHSLEEARRPVQQDLQSTLLEVVGGNSISNHVGLSGSAHPPTEKYSHEGPPHPPKEKYSLQTESGEAISNPFECYALAIAMVQLISVMISVLPSLSMSV